MPLLTLPTIAFLLWAAFTHNPYGFYTFLRWEVCIATGIVAWTAYEKKNTALMTCLIIAGLIFNPILPLHLGRGVQARENWAVFNFAAAGIMLWAAITLWPKPEPPAKAEDSTAKPPNQP